MRRDRHPNAALPPIIRVLKAAREDHNLPLAQFSEEELRWAIESGLGPLLLRLSKHDGTEERPATRQLLLAAELTARVLTGAITDAMGEIIDACQSVGTPPTLLKGISICEQYYTAAHLRPMRDIDLLIAKPSYDAVESALINLGYRRQEDQPASAWKDHHHGPPLFHPGRQVWVELHTSLFAKEAPVSHAAAFSAANIESEQQPSAFHGKPVFRLSDELQLLYIACRWAWDLSRDLGRPGAVIPLLDAIYLTQASGHSLRWDRILGWLDNEYAARYLFVTLTFLTRYELVSLPAGVMTRLATQRHRFSNAEVKIIHRFIDRHLIAGEPFGRVLNSRNASIVCETLLAPGPLASKLVRLPWNILFSPRDPARFDFRHQMHRIRSLWRRQSF